MPGILGTISKDSRDNSTLFSQMLSSVNHFDYKVDSTLKKNVSLGRVHLDYVNNKTDFAVSNDGRYLLTLIGEIFSYKDIETPQIVDDQQFLLDIFIRDGIDCLKSINGHFTAAIYDFVEEKLLLISDRMGTRPHYYANTSNGFVFAPEVKAILKAGIDKEINYSAIAELFSFGHLFGSKTLFKNIHQLPPASYLVYSKGEYSFHKYWDFPCYEEAYTKEWPSKKRINSYTEEFIDIFSNAMKRNFSKNSDKILISLSGGLDSRFVAAFAKKFGINPLVSFTMGPEGSEDQMYAKQVAEKTGMQYNPFVVKPDNIWEDASKFSYFSDYMSLINGPIQAFEAVKELKKRTEVTITSQMCDAFFGSTLARSRFQVLSNKKSFDAEAVNIISNSFNLFSNHQIKQVFESESYRKISGLQANVPEQYMKTSRIPLEAYLNLLFNEHGRRGTLGGNIMYNLFLETRMPSYDNDVFEFANKLPLKLRENQYLYRKGFSILFPELTKIKRQHFNLPIDASNARYKLRILENKAVTILKSSKLNPVISLIPKYNTPSYTSYNEWFKNELYENMSSLLLDKRTLSRGIFKEDAVKNLIATHKTTSNDHSRLLWQMINLEYFFRNYID